MLSTKTFFFQIHLEWSFKKHKNWHFTDSTPKYYMNDQ